jgi:hypothetical protein
MGFQLRAGFANADSQFRREAAFGQQALSDKRAPQARHRIEMVAGRDIHPTDDSLRLGKFRRWGCGRHGDKEALHLLEGKPAQSQISREQ